MAREDSLQQELSVFNRYKNEWLQSNPGEFVVVASSKVVGFYPDYESAFNAGLKAVGLGNDFLVKQVSVEDPAYLIS